MLSSLPTAVTANVLRVTATGALHETVGAGAADAFFHDLSGWLMMPVALGLLWLEMQVLARCLVESVRAPVPIGLAGEGRRA